jgi:hypothetical protein
VCPTTFIVFMRTHQNGANSHGGALAIISGSIEMQSCNFTTNAAADSFPAVYDGGGSLQYLDCDVQENMEVDFEAVKDSFARSQNAARQQRATSNARPNTRPLEDLLELAGRPPR